MGGQPGTPPTLKTLAEGRRQRSSRGEPPVWLLVQGVQDGRLSRLGQIGAQRSRWGRWLLGLLAHQLDHRTPLKGDPPGDHLVEHHPQTVQIGRRSYRSSLKLLRGHVGECPHHLSRRGQLGMDLGQQPSNAEVGEVGVPLHIEQDIGWLDISVDYPLAMGIVQCLGNRSKVALDGGER